MLPTKQNLPVEIPSSENISILLVSPCAEDYGSLKSLLYPTGITVFRCGSAGDALQQISSQRPAVVVCERDLPDGNWITILAACEASKDTPLVLVVSRSADESLWAEVLNLGGYDVLLKPFDRNEVVRVFAMALRQWFKQRPELPVTTVSVARRETPQYA